MAKLLQALLLVAGLLWSGVCVAQCRVLPQQAKKASKKQLPPCHKTPVQEPQEDCKDEGCSVSFADAEKSFDAAVDLAVGFEYSELPPFALSETRTFESFSITRPPNSISILRL